jgi:AraC family transcriptional regulator of adaptative response/methylated-DNA-[protein]-cysteine methyltransferase
VDTTIFDRPAMMLRFGFGETRLGTVLAAVSNKGLAAILLGDDRPRLQRELARAFPHAELTRDEAALSGMLAKIVAGVDAPGSTLDVPLDLHGSALELAVWEALRAIPPGETRSYGQLAKTLPIPATAQDVGAACAANVLAVIIPCHRVVKADGSIAGYRWGVSRKRRLLELEHAA